MNVFHNYSNQWHLTLNLTKTKVVVFGARNINALSFKLGDSPITITDTYHYLGVTFSSSGSFLAARKHVNQQANKELFQLYTKSNKAKLPIDLTLKLFNSTVLPILVYGSELFGFENLEIIERVHTSFLRRITKAPATADSHFVNHLVI